MRIAHFGSKGIPAKSGTERVVEAVATRHAVQHEVTVYGNARVCSSGTYQGVRVRALPTSTAKHVGPVVLQLRAALHALMKERYDVAHVHASENGFVVPLLRLRYPVVTTNHGPAYAREKWAAAARRLIRSNERFSVRSATIATAVAASQARLLSARYRRAVRYIPNGVESDGQRANGESLALLGSLGLKAREYVLFAGARVDPTKGCHTLLNACRLMSVAPEVLVVGDLHHAPGYEAKLRALAEDLPIRFWPRLDDKAVLMGLLENCRLFVFPSTIEAMSMMLLEALAVGAPAVVSDIPENLDVLPEGVATFKAGDAVDLARALREALAIDPAEARARAAEAAATMCAEHDWDPIADQYLAVYESAVRQR